MRKNFPLIQLYIKSCECYDASALSEGDITDPFRNSLFSQN